MHRHSKSSSSIGSIQTNHESRKSRSRASSSAVTGHHHEEQDPDRFFVVPRGVIVEYGPYTFHGSCDFRQERLQGIQNQLEKLGARVKMTACTDFVNRVQVWYMDDVIFSCKITDLQHGGDGELDRLCIDAARAFDRASRKAIQGLRHRIAVDNKELVDPFCPCLNPPEEAPEDGQTNSEDDEDKTPTDSESI